MEQEWKQGGVWGVGGIEETMESATNQSRCLKRKALAAGTPPLTSLPPSLRSEWLNFDLRVTKVFVGVGQMGLFSLPGPLEPEILASPPPPTGVRSDVDKQAHAVRDLRVTANGWEDKRRPPTGAYVEADNHARPRFNKSKKLVQN